MASCDYFLACRSDFCGARYLYRGVDSLKELANFPYVHVLVLGLAKSGTAAARLLLQNGRKVRVNDKNANDDDAIVDELKSMGAEVVTGSHPLDRKSTRLNSSHVSISYAVFCLKKKKTRT